MENENDLTVSEAMVDYKKHYTYADYMSWDDEIRRELIYGIPYVMSAPTTRHQSISVSLNAQFYNFLKGKQCKVFHAPFDVRLNADAEDDTVVQPDIVVICDHTKIEKTGCRGAPDLIIEILSPSNSAHDTVLKLKLYQENNVREYWIVDPDEKLVHIYIMEDRHYFLNSYKEESQKTGSDLYIPVRSLKGCVINITEVFME